MQPELLKNISGIQDYHNSLIKLSERWDLLTLLGQMSNIGMDMTETKNAFQMLTNDLLQKLTDETIKKTTDQFASISQVAVDIVIRNLFERTADIGFLATDQDIRNYLIEIKTSGFDGEFDVEAHQQREEYLAKRFMDYVAKYSVYSDIVLLDTSGNVLVRLDSTQEVSSTDDPLVADAINTSDEYVEIYRHVDLCPDQENSLVYAFRVTEDNSEGSEALGVLALVFRFDNEMDGVFSNLKSDDDWFEISLLDQSGRVISSSDPYHIPIGARMDMVVDDAYRIVRFGGREYVAKTSKSNGYQGFFGLGWYGHIMAPVEKAFDNASCSSSTVDESVFESVMSSSDIFPEELKTIPVQAEHIQKELNTTVWNGNVQIANTKMGDNSFSKSLLREISTTGDSTKNIFEQSISNLNATVIGSLLDNVEFQAALAIDIMDRNLYERANDCRWWALTSYFRETMEKSVLEPETKSEITSILAYINNLYTVYTNLIVYDATGVIIAVSNPAEQHFVGRKINSSWVQATLSIKDPQRYSVSDFEQTDYYGGRPTYIYGAPILSKRSQRKALGGIAVVFDSEPEFKAMLEDALPKDDQGEIVHGCMALFLDRDRHIIASSSEAFKVGDVLNIDEQFFSCPNGRGYATIINYHGDYYVTGSMTSKGYREYKTIDGYTQDIVALVLVRIGKVTEKNTGKTIPMRAYAYPRVQGNEESMEVSTVLISQRLYGIPSHYIVSSLTGQEVTQILGSDSRYLGVITYLGHTVPVVSLRNMIDPHEDNSYDVRQHAIVVINDQNRWLGIVVDEVRDSPSIPMRCIDQALNLGSESYTSAVVKPESTDTKKEMLAILDIRAIYMSLIQESPQNTVLLDQKKSA
ncbi:MAG: chemotaxis protein CheW [Thiotrichales bacterium]